MNLRSNLASALAGARAQTDRLFRLVRVEALYERPVPERHRLIFYLGHLEAFDWNLICAGKLEMPRFHPAFDRLFAFGIDPPPGQSPADRPSDWPSAEEVNAYGRQVRERLDQVLVQAPEECIHAAIEHRLMHAETFAYLLHSLPVEQKLPQAPEAGSGQPAPRPQMIEIPSGKAILGRPRGDGFGWDNEFVEHAVEAPAFAIGKYKITNHQYLQFVEDGGPAPHFWKQDGRQWRYRTMFGEIPLPLSWPAYVTYAQAAQYAAWAGKSLPTEAQFHRAAYGGENERTRPYPWGAAPPNATRGNFDFARWNPLPVDATPAGDSALGVSQLVGNGWEWTSTVFHPFPGFQPLPFYPGYSADFFDGAHFVLKGGSARTAAVLLRRSFRNWFRPGYPHAYAGFRCVEN
jgi:iron(II)-dependent oxidoreductase